MLSRDHESPPLAAQVVVLTELPAALPHLFHGPAVRPDLLPEREFPIRDWPVSKIASTSIS